MTVIGMIIAAIILVLSVYLIGPYGIAFLIILLFGLVFSTHQKNKQIYEDLKLVREKLGLLTEDEKTQFEMEKIKENPQLIPVINREIEEELEKSILDSMDVEEKDKKDDKNG